MSGAKDSGNRYLTPLVGRSGTLPGSDSAAIAVTLSYNASPGSTCGGDYNLDA